MGADGEGPLPRTRRVPHPSRLAPDHPRYAEIIAAHEVAMAAGEPGYADPDTGWFVFTAASLWARGCCMSGCRHCPFVPGPRPGGADDGGRQLRPGTE